MTADGDLPEDRSLLLVDDDAAWRERLAKAMERRGFESVADLRGRLASRRLADPEAYVRAQYIHILTSYGR